MFNSICPIFLAQSQIFFQDMPVHQASQALTSGICASHLPPTENNNAPFLTAYGKENSKSCPQTSNDKCTKQRWNLVLYSRKTTNLQRLTENVFSYFL